MRVAQSSRDGESTVGTHGVLMHRSTERAVWQAHAGTAGPGEVF